MTSVGWVGLGAWYSHACWMLQVPVGSPPHASRAGQVPSAPTPPQPLAKTTPSVAAAMTVDSARSTGRLKRTPTTTLRLGSWLRPHHHQTFASSIEARVPSETPA